MAELVEIAEATEEVADLVVSSRRALTVGIVAGALIGGSLAWYIANRRLNSKYEAVAEEEIAMMREHFKDKEKARYQAFEKNKEALLAAEREKVAVKQIVEEEEYAAKAEPGAPNTGVMSESETRNIFEDRAPTPPFKNPADTWDYEVELRNRAKGKPYVIHEDEQHEKSYNEVTFTYYEGDDVLCEGDERIIENRYEVIGDNLDKFGHGSSDPMIVYIRNDEIAADIEVVRSTGSYAEEVHGLKHADEAFQPVKRRANRHDE